MDTAPLRWQDGALVLLDQRELPARETWLHCYTPDDVADAIRSLAVRGAPALGIAGAYGLVLAVAGTQRCAEEERVGVADAAAALRATRPTAVNLGWALDRGVAAFELAQSLGEDPAEALLRSAHALVADQMAADRRLSDLAAERFVEGDRALTHCNAGPLATGGYGTAGGVLRAAWEAGRLAQVWVCETRPLLQGARLTAWELGRAGIPHRLVTDSSAGALMARGLVDRVVVGADRVAANGDVANNVGTYTLAVLAARHEIPFYVAAPTSTVDPTTPDGASVEIEERDPGEVTGAGGTSWAPAGTQALNLAFDITPGELITAIATEAGMLEPPYGPAIARLARPLTV